MRPEAARVEVDMLGAREVPADAYWGIHTLRALENFPISGVPLSTYPALIRALAMVKQAAALANGELGLLPGWKVEAIVAACVAVRSGELDREFPIDVIQGGAGTSTNMNGNEVIANRALEELGHPKSAYGYINPIEDVNKGQSTNDVYPTAVKIATDQLLGDLVVELLKVARAFEEKSVEFACVVKVGRTQLQDAVPMTLGQEFHAFSVTLSQEESHLNEARRQLRQVHLGGTAVGTGLGTHPTYTRLAVRHLRHLWRDDVVAARDYIEATQDSTFFVYVSSALKQLAVKLTKVCSDLRLLSSGPHAGLGEISLPPVQAGSSLMPGKINPVIPEVINQVAFEVIGNDVAITMASAGGQLQLNAFEPVMVHKLLEGIAHLTAACSVLAQRCVAGIEANEARTTEHVHASTGIAAVLNNYVGYQRASEFTALALNTGRPLRDVVAEANVLEPELLELVFDPLIAATGPPSPAVPCAQADRGT